MPWHPAPQNAPAQRLRGPVGKALEIKARALARAARRQALRAEHQAVLRDLAELASRILRRRRCGDGTLDHR